jgi:transcriptional regulator with XRE-family HTH domain
MKNQPRIKNVEVGSRTRELIIYWETGKKSIVNVSSLIETVEFFAPLESYTLFSTVHVGKWGWTVEWSNDIDLGADLLWRMALEQTGEAMSPVAFKEWRRKHKLSQVKTAEELGLTKRTINYYESGEKIIPKTVLLATRGYDASELNQPTVSRALSEWEFDKEFISRVQDAVLERLHRNGIEDSKNSFVASASELNQSNADIVDLAKFRREQGLSRRAG